MYHLVMTKIATTMSEDMDDYVWAKLHPGLILLICGCWWCDQTGDLRALPTCMDHTRDVERYGK